MKIREGNILLIILVAVAALAIGAGGMWWWTQKNIPQPVSAPEITKPVDETKNWKIYTNSFYNYTFKYPVNWQITDCGQNIEIAIHQLDCRQPLPDTSNLDLAIFPSQDPNKMIQDTLTLDGQTYKVTTSIIQLAGIAATKENLSQKSGGPNPGKPSPSSSGPDFAVSHIYFAKGNYVYEFTKVLTNNEDSSSIDNLFDQILSTFKFLDQNLNETANWKTYLYADYNFSLSLPSSWTLEKYTDPYDHSIRLTFKPQSSRANYVEITINQGPPEACRKYSDKGCRTIDVAGVTAFRYSLPLAQNPAQEGATFGKGLFRYQVWLFYTDKSYVDIYNQILSTFKFLNQ